MTKIYQKKLSEICKHVSQYPTDTILLVIDKKIQSLYGKKIKFQGKKLFTFVTPEGEKAKDFASYEKGLKFFLQNGIHRNAHLLAIGGGATSDLAGFMAATLLRGLNWSVVPTTLLSMVDAGLGGKTGINCGAFKNQIGSVHLPQNVYIDVGFLESLEREQFLSGCGEILKYSYLSSKVQMTFKKKGLGPELIMACLDFKNKIVTQDPYETKNIRPLLNLGHTLGHGFEKLWGLPHGLAVACGIGEILRLFAGPKEVENWHERMRSLGFDISMERLSPKEIRKLMELVCHDKKIFAQNQIQLVIPQKGKVVLKKMKLSELEERLFELYGY